MQDSLGDRMKSSYESRAQSYLPRRTYTIARIDGRAFHTWTKSAALDSPFDVGFAEDIDTVAAELLKHVQGAFMAYTQSDEISIAMSDFATTETDAFFDGNVQKLSSVLASYATAVFATLRTKRTLKASLGAPLSPGMSAVDLLTRTVDDVVKTAAQPATFDCRVFVIPDKVEVGNYFVWRQADAIRNAISALAEHHLGHNAIVNVNTRGRMKLLADAGRPIDGEPIRFQRGGLVLKDDVCIAHPDCFRFTGDFEKLLGLIPEHGYSKP